MTLEDLKKEHPDLYAEAFRAGKEAGISDERARVAALKAWSESNPETEAVVNEAVVNGQTVDQIMPKLMAAVKAGVSGAAAGEQPPKVRTAVVATGSGETGSAGEISDEEIQAAVAKLPKA